MHAARVGVPSAVVSDVSRGEPDSAVKPAALLPGVEVGAILAGKYRVERILGAGGMGVVVAAHHLHLDEPVAIKFLLPEILQNREIVARFLREARGAIKIKSEHVARVTDVGTLDNGAPYMVMEFLDGRDLASWISERGPLSVEDTVEFVLQACEALAEAHVLKMVHRDLKPANLFVVRRADGLSAIRVLDFGISKMANSSLATSGFGVTKTSDIMGSPLYMAPEQMLASHDVDMRSDIWSLGVVIHEMITGKVPFEGETIPEVCAKILRDAPEPMSRRKPGVPPGLDAVVLRCLEKERGNRYQNVAELANALVGYGPPRARASADRINRIIQAAGLSQPQLPPQEPTPVEPKPIAQNTSLLLGSERSRPSTFLEDTISAQTALGPDDLGSSLLTSTKKVVVVAAAVVLAIVVAVVALATRRSGPQTSSSTNVGTPAKTPELPSAPQRPPTVSPNPAVVPAPAIAPPAPTTNAGGQPPGESHEPSQRRKREPGASQPKTSKAAAPQPAQKSASPRPPAPKPNRMLDLMDDRK